MSDAASGTGSESAEEPNSWDIDVPWHDVLVGEEPGDAPGTSRLSVEVGGVVAVRDFSGSASVVARVESGVLTCFAEGADAARSWNDDQAHSVNVRCWWRNDGRTTAVLALSPADEPQG